MRQRFNRSASVVLDAAGDGELQIQPPGMDWEIISTVVSTSTRVLEPECRLTKNGTDDGAMVDGTYAGSWDVSDTVIPLQAGDVLYVAWTGGDVGATATVRVSGWQYPPGEGV
jgi:hypothetical protein